MTGTPVATEFVRRHRLYEEVAHRIETQIHDGRYRPGDALPSERELMQRYGVGRPSVREALFHLRKMGLVEVRPGGRARVTRPTPQTVVASLSGAARHMLAAPDGIRHFQEARVFFEVGLVRHAAEHATKAQHAELAAALAANRAAIGDIAAFERTDVAFHYVLAVIPKNPIFPAIHQAIAEWLLEQRHTTLSWPGRRTTARTAYDAHAEIHAEIEARSPDRAEQAMRTHLAHVARVYWEARGTAPQRHAP